MKKWLLGSLVCCFSCSGEEELNAPANLIPTEKMIPIVVDLQILESHFQRLYQRPDLYKNALDSSSVFVFDDYGVTKESFDSSYTYYSKNTYAIYGIYEAALDSINFRLSQPSH